MRDRVTSGVPAIDTNIEGGFPNGSVISYYGRTSPYRKYCLLRFLEQQDGESLYINTKDSIDIISTEAKFYDISLDTTQFLDGVHWRNKRVNPKLESKAMFEVNNLTDLNALLAKIMDACKHRPISRIVFDSPSSILLYTTPGYEQVYKFFELLTAFLRQNKINLIFTLEEGVHPEKVVNTIHYLSDGVLIFDIEKINHQFIPTLRISQMLLTSFSYDKILLDSIISSDKFGESTNQDLSHEAVQ